MGLNQNPVSEGCNSNDNDKRHCINQYINCGSKIMDEDQLFGVTKFKTSFVIFIGDHKPYEREEDGDGKVIRRARTDINNSTPPHTKPTSYVIRHGDRSFTNIGNNKNILTTTTTTTTNNNINSKKLLHCKSNGCCIHGTKKKNGGCVNPEVRHEMTTLTVTSPMIASTHPMTAKPPEVKIVSRVDFDIPRRFKNEVKAYPKMCPEKYAETCYVSTIDEQKRYVTTTYLQPRLRPRSQSETVYTGPREKLYRYKTTLAHPVVDSEGYKCKGPWFETSIEL